MSKSRLPCDVVKRGSRQMCRLLSPPVRVDLLRCSFSMCRAAAVGVGLIALQPAVSNNLHTAGRAEPQPVSSSSCAVLFLFCFICCCLSFSLSLSLSPYLSLSLSFTEGRMNVVCCSVEQKAEGERTVRETKKRLNLRREHTHMHARTKINMWAAYFVCWIQYELD